MKAHGLLLFLLTLMLTSAACKTEMSKDCFFARIHQHAHETVNDVRYIGSADGYDYFCHTTTLSNRRIRIAERDIPLPARFPLTHDEKEWVLYEWLSSREYFDITGLENVMLIQSNGN